MNQLGIMNNFTQFVSIQSISGTVYVVMRQEQRSDQLNTSNIVDIIINQEQFSGLMYALKAIERQFIEDQTNKLMNEVEQTLTIGNYIETYDPTKPALNLDDPKRKKAKAKNAKESMSIKKDNVIKAPDLY